MRRLVSALALLAFVSSLAAADDRAAIIETLPVAPPPWTGAAAPTHELRLHLHAFAGTSWRAADILAAVREALQILAQCGVVLAGAELRLVAAPPDLRYYSTQAATRLLRSLAVARPAIFFVEDTRNEPAFDAEAIGRGNSATRPELVDTIWIAHGARDLPLALAHELVHVLSDSGGHASEEGNLMLPDTSPANTRLSPRQCERLRTRGTENGLLVRREK